MIESISMKIATAIKSASSNKDANEEVIQFGLLVIFNTGSIFILCFLIGILTRNPFEVMLALISFSSLRAVSGGFHLKTSMGCIILTVITMMTIPIIPLSSNIGIMLITIASLVLVLIYAPSNIERQTRVPEQYFFIFKIIAALIVSINLFLQIDVLALAFFIQALSLIKKGGSRYVEKKSS